LADDTSAAAWWAAKQESTQNEEFYSGHWLPVGKGAETAEVAEKRDAVRDRDSTCGAVGIGHVMSMMTSASRQAIVGLN